MAETDIEIRTKQLIDRLKAKTKLNDDRVESVLRVADASYGFSNWGIINAVTEVAQNYTLEKRVELERLAANMLGAV